MFSGKTKKKLQAVQLLNDQCTKEIADQQHELEEVQHDIEKIDEDIHTAEDGIKRENTNKELADAENEKLAQELENLNTELSELRRKLEESKKATSKAKKEKEDLYAELVQCETLVTQEHREASAAADAAREEANKLRQEQEEQRRRWQDTRLAHEELQRQVDAGMQQVSQAHGKYEAAKRDCTATKNELQDLQKSHRNLSDDQQAAEISLAEQQQKGARLEADLNDLLERTRKMEEEHALLQSKHEERQKQLLDAKRDLDGKRDAMNQELSRFEMNFQEAKGQRERLLGENDEARRELSNFLPQYFKLQTEHSQKQRELEQTRRTHETLKWENHKVQRDLGMLTKSYDAGYLPTLTTRSMT
mmetsp:Transcript_70855/g.133934  ORF Transcript_70855/g.133934 Transcript_70855/m.133934 type:complete len:362 (+) Transcript_70855:96-1181(+)